MNRFSLMVFLAVSALSIPMHGQAASCAGFADVDDASQFCTNVTWIKNRNINEAIAMAPGGRCRGLR